MSRNPGLPRPEVARLGHAARVAAAVAGLTAILYVAVTVPFDFAESRHLVAEVDAKLSDRLADLARSGYVQSGYTRFGPLPAEDDVSQAPVVVWEVRPSGKAVALSAGAPALADGAWPRPGRSVTERLGVDVFRLRSARSAGTLVVVGQSLAEANRVASALQLAEAVGGPVFVLVVFLAAFGIGAVASKPVEEARRRQVEFTADASHELRTPITVIEAEVGLALGSPRKNDAYREALERVGRESKRLRRIVEDMLFLARFGTAPPPPGEELVDLVTVAEACVNRFAAVAKARGAELSLESRLADGALINAPPEWVDRLCGTLVDNACKHAGPGGRARVAVEVRGQTVTLLVEDSGPGIPPEERPYLFDRFHKGNGSAEGAGLGLAIADAVVGATGGRWRVGTSVLGGAYMAVSWRRYWPREIPASRRHGWLTMLRQPSVQGDGDP